MKYIKKGDEPEEFIKWKALRNQNWEPVFTELRGAEKEAVLDALMREQGYLCCYCESRVGKGKGHIEHLVPQSAQRTDPLEYGNMLCSCQSRLKAGEPRHCGSLKGDWYDRDLLVSPLEPGCEKRFSFLYDGRIEPADSHDKGAKESIRRLGLNIPKLIDTRKKALEPFLDEMLSPDDLAAFVHGFLQTDAHGRFPEFYTTIKYLFQ